MSNFDLKATFSLPNEIPDGITVVGNAQPTEFTPAVDQDYKFRVDLIRDMMGFWVSGERAMLIIGHSGSCLLYTSRCV